MKLRSQVAPKIGGIHLESAFDVIGGETHRNSSWLPAVNTFQKIGDVRLAQTTEVASVSENLVEQGIRLRTEAYETTSLLLNEKIENGEFDSSHTSYGGTFVDFSEITAVAFAEYQANWHGHPQRFNDWDWKEWHRGFRNSPSRFEAALWGDNALCGLAIGRLSKGRSHLSVHLLEGSPDSRHPLKGRVRHCILELAEFYADIWDCRTVKLIEPVEQVIPLYVDMGYVVARRGHTVISCDKELY